MSTPVTAHRATGAETLLTVLLKVGAAWTASAANFWTFEIRVKRAATSTGQASAQAIGELVATYALDAISIALGEEVVVYSDQRGFALKVGDEVVVYRTATGSPAALTDATMPMLFQRNVR